MPLVTTRSSRPCCRWRVRFGSRMCRSAAQKRPRSLRRVRGSQFSTRRSPFPPGVRRSAALVALEIASSANAAITRRSRVPWPPFASTRPLLLPAPLVLDATNSNMRACGGSGQWAKSAEWTKVGSRIERPRRPSDAASLGGGSLVAWSPRAWRRWWPNQASPIRPAPAADPRHHRGRQARAASARRSAGIWSPSPPVERRAPAPRAGRPVFRPRGSSPWAVYRQAVGSSSQNLPETEV